MTPDALDVQLTRLTQWEGDAPDLWRRALGVAQPQNRGPSTFTVLSRRAPSWAMPLIGVAAVFVVMVGITMTTFNTTRYSPESVPAVNPVADEDLTASTLSSGLERPSSPADGRGSGRGGDSADQFPHHGYLAAPAEEKPATASPSPAAGERHVVRKATIELTAADVRAAFLKAAQLISEARGEYVQDSALTGNGNQLQANLTLRVAADRLPAVLNELRQLGAVQSERSDGQDVTTQVVDLEARLRNEKRIEAELLGLLDSRKDAPLKEILELRDNLSRVRASIEQLFGPCEHLSRLVSLATILVIIRPPDAPATPPPAGIGAYFSDAFSGAWHKGIRVLADTIAVLLGAIIGGLPWWIALVTVILIVRAARRQPQSVVS